jgi:hypothetical protein
MALFNITIERARLHHNYHFQIEDDVLSRLSIVAYLHGSHRLRLLSLGHCKRMPLASLIGVFCMASIPPPTIWILPVYV